MDCVIEGRQDLYESGKLGEFIARGLNQDHSILCAKLVHLNDQRDLDSFKKEIQFLEITRKYPHRNIINYEGYYILEEKRDKFHAFKTGHIIMEKGITNLDYLLQKRIKSKEDFTAQEYIHFMKSMLAAHLHLQQLNIAHRDIKPENIILFNQEELLFKICDVGVGTESRGENTKTRTLIGTVAYLSPELFSAYQQLRSRSNYNPYKSDTFSLGLVFLYFGALHRFDVRSRNAEQITQYQETLRYLIKQIKKKYPIISGISKILKKMLDYDENARADFLELNQFILANQYLQLQHENNESFTLVNHKGLPQQYVQYFFKDISKIEGLETNQNQLCYDFQLNNLSKSPEETQQCLEEIKNRLKGTPLRALSVNLELNMLEHRHIKPLIEFLEKNPQLEELKLYFWNNALRNAGLALLSDPISKMSNLRSLHFSLSSNGVTDQGVNQGIKPLSKLKNLTELCLDFGMNRLSVDCAESIFFVLTNLADLQSLELNLESNNLNLLISKLLCDHVKSLKKLQRLQINFSNNILQDQGLFEIGGVLQNIQECSIILWNCNIKDKGLNEFSKGLSSCQTLTNFNLILWNNQITVKGCEQLAKSLESLKLTELQINLSNNKIGDQGIKSLGQSLTKLNSLEKLILHFDNVGCTQNACRYIGRIIVHKLFLKSLAINLRSNDIDQEGAELLSAGLQQSGQIQNVSINLENTKIKGEGMKFLFQGLSKIKSIVNLQLNFQDSQINDEYALGILQYVIEWKFLEDFSIDLRKNSIDQKVIETVRTDTSTIAHKAKIDIKFTQMRYNE